MSLFSACGSISRRISCVRMYVACHSPAHSDWQLPLETKQSDSGASPDGPSCACFASYFVSCASAIFGRRRLAVCISPTLFCATNKVSERAPGRTDLCAPASNFMALLFNNAAVPNFCKRYLAACLHRARTCSLHASVQCAAMQTVSLIFEKLSFGVVRL